MLVLSWDAVVIVVFEYIFKDISNGYIIAARTIIMLLPCYFIGFWAGKIQKHFDL